MNLCDICNDEDEYEVAIETERGWIYLCQACYHGIIKHYWVEELKAERREKEEWWQAPQQSSVQPANRDPGPEKEEK